MQSLYLFCPYCFDPWRDIVRFWIIGGSIKSRKIMYFFPIETVPIHFCHNLVLALIIKGNQKNIITTLKKGR